MAANGVRVWEVELCITVGLLRIIGPNLSTPLRVKIRMEPAIAGNRIQTNLETPSREKLLLEVIE